MGDPARLTLVAVFLCMSALYLWRTANEIPLALHGGASGQYNALADAFLHFRMWILRFPASLLGPEPLNPALKPAVLNSFGDDSLYGGKLYISWGPAPVLVLLVPLHLLFGYEPSGSVIIAPFAIVGLGFALAALHVCLERFHDVALWMRLLAGLTLACTSVVPQLLLGSVVYQQAVAAGYCFTMAGLWLAASAITRRGASLRRLGLMSLCFGLAAGSRPTLALTALILIPVYAALRPTRPRRRLLAALVLPVGTCFLLLAAYNYARYGSPLEIGTKYQVGASHLYLAELRYVPMGLWSYLLTPPRLSALFPFIAIVAPQLSYPLSLPAHYASYSEPTGGLLATTPISIFVVALPWMARRRPAPLRSLGPFLVAMASAGVGIVVFLSYVNLATSERYAADYTTLFVLGSLVVWLALSGCTRGRRRLLMRIGGGLLAAWSCMAGLAVGYGVGTHPDTWRTMDKLGSPLSTAIASVAGHAILTEVYTPNILSGIPEDYSLSPTVSPFWLGARDRADLTVVSPDARNATLVANVVDGSALSAGTLLEARISGPGAASHTYPLPAGGGEVRLAIHVDSGVNQLALSPIGAAEGGTGAGASSVSGSQALMVVTAMYLAGSGS